MAWIRFDLIEERLEERNGPSFGFGFDLQRVKFGKKLAEAFRFGSILMNLQRV